MPKIKNLKEIKSKIKIIKEIKRGESELVEDVKEAEEHSVQVFREDLSGVKFRPPSIALESDLSETDTAIQQETKERNEIEERNIAYTPRGQAGAQRSYQERRNFEESNREYSHAEDSSRVPAMRFEDRAPQQRIMGKGEIRENFPMQNSEISDERLEVDRKKYKTRRE